MSLAREQFEAFRNAFVAVSAELLSEDLLVDVLRSDGSLHADELHIDTALALRDGGHWGQGYPEPLFDDVFAVVGWRVLKEKHLKLELQRGQQRFNAIQFNGWDGVEPARNTHLSLIHI